MSRIKVINKLIADNKYYRYLEIGTQNDVCLSGIKCAYKVGVDPYPISFDDNNADKFFEGTSDDFFPQNKEKFDIIFIDGLHHSVQVRADVLNALSILNDGGAIVMHDCSPESFKAQTIPETHLPTWNGDVWKAWIWFRINRSDLSMYVLNTDQGCGVIQVGSQKLLKFTKELTYENLDKNRKEWLNLVEYEKI